MSIRTDNLRITKLRQFLFGVIDEIVSNDEYQININMLSDDIDNYSLDKIPVASEVETWITGIEKHRDVYIFRSRMAYSQDVMVNLENVGFYEIFEKIIDNRKRNNILPDIDGIESITYLNAGSMNNANTNTCEFQIQLEIQYTVLPEEIESL